MAQVQIDQQKAQAALIAAQAQQHKVEMHGIIESSREKLAEEQRQKDNMFKAQESHRKDMDMANKITISQREMALAEANPPNQESVNVSPKG